MNHKSIPKQNVSNNWFSYKQQVKFILTRFIFKIIYFIGL